MKIIDSIKMKGDADFVTKCKCIKEYPMPDQGDGDWERIKEGESYNYTFDDLMYYVRTYSPDFIPGKNGKIVERGQCSTILLSADKFKEYFTIE